MPISHPFPPLYDKNAKVLILGSFPSVKSRETGFFYGHKQNRFWKIMAEVLDYPHVPETVEDKTKMLREGGIALWDTIASCEIAGSSDASITNAVPNDLRVILDHADIRRICCNGTKSYELFMKYTAPKVRDWEEEKRHRNGSSAAFPETPPHAQITFVRLPSTSPASASWSKERLAAEWKRLLFG